MTRSFGNGYDGGNRSTRLTGSTFSAYPGACVDTIAEPTGRATGWVGRLTVLLALTGCGTDDPGIVPDSAKGRAVLARAMEAWVAGRPVGMLEGTGPAVQVIDSYRKAGQTLAGYEIQAETATPRARTFSLKLTLEHPDEHALVRYLVVGIDPVLIFRQEDYELLTHFEHKMDAEPEGP
jgi:hypothetical protein